MAVPERQRVRERYDVVVVGGGLSGVCAALACARGGARTALVQNRPVLGGNASSEVRMHICGADYHGSRPGARETGIIEELLLENRLRNPQVSFSVFDTILWEKVHFQERLELYLNTHMTEVVSEGPRVRRIRTEQLTTERRLELAAELFVDATGDGTLAFLAGAQVMKGREGREVFGEAHAPQKSDPYTMGNSLLFRAVDLGRPVPFTRPPWANTYTEEDLAGRGYEDVGAGYWWVELGGKDTDVIADGETIRDQLLEALYGVWDHIKNSGHHGAENFALDWVGFLPGKQESRRIVGDYVLVEQDLAAGRVFEDTVAYGGWPMDIHAVGGLRGGEAPNHLLELPEVYTVPYRCLYARDLENLFLCGRIISASHLAMSSLRVMATCAVVGQAAGTAAAIAASRGLAPRQVPVLQLQRRLMRDDCYLPAFRNEDPDDLARGAVAGCSSCEVEGAAANLLNGYPRGVGGRSNCWVSLPLRREGEWVELDFRREVAAAEVNLRFDSNLSREIMPSLSAPARKQQVPGVSPQLVRDYAVELYREGQLAYREEVTGNHLRHRVHRLPEPVPCDRLRVHVQATHGDRRARIFELRVY